MIRVQYTTGDAGVLTSGRAGNRPHASCALGLLSHMLGLTPVWHGNHTRPARARAMARAGVSNAHLPCQSRLRPVRALANPGAA